MIVGFIWYGPLFGKAWSREMGWGAMTGEQVQAMKKKAMFMYPQQFIAALLMAYVFAHVLGAFYAAQVGRSVGTGLQGAFWMWLGFILPLKYAEKLFGGKSWKLFLIDSGYWLVSILVMGAIIAGWE